MIFKDEIKAVRKFKKSINRSIQKTVRTNSEVLLDYNRNKQLAEHGETDLGAAITPFYTPYTISLKRDRSQEVGWVTLKDTGAFHRSFRLVAYNNQFIISAGDSKTQELQEKYEKRSSGHILGIQPTYRFEFVKKFILPQLRIQAKKIMKF